MDINSHTPAFQDDRKIVSCKEKQCVYRCKNDARHSLRFYNIDGGVIQDNSVIRCDKLLLDDTQPKAIYIELKGPASEIDHAMEQIENTIRMFQGSLHGYRVFRRIVHRSATHSIQGSKIDLWKRKHGKSAAIGKTPFEDDIQHMDTV